MRLHEQGLIYRDRTLINWCPRCETALSDLEVSHKDADGQLYFIRYPLEDGSGAITVATTRPETMLGDTAVAVNPADPRYQHLIGKSLRLPLAARMIPIIADASVDSSFGTGAVKITPAHDFNDFAIGKAHGLDEIAIMDATGRMNAAAGAYAGMDRDEVPQGGPARPRGARAVGKHPAASTCGRRVLALRHRARADAFGAVVRARQAAGGQGDRGGARRPTPRSIRNFGKIPTSTGWRISTTGVSRASYGGGIASPPTIAATAAIPPSWRDRPSSCERCESANLVQVEDVLDTWFSSGLWPFSTLGWPDDTPDLRRYYPTTLLVTGFDIIFFWVARMMMLGLWFTEQVPFRDVYITPLVRDQFGKKMTKSRGNVVDPLEIMDTYGTDAVRFTLAQLAVQGRDLILSNDRLAASRAFANKIWNAARFVMMNLEDAPQPIASVPTAKLGLAERWILSRLRNAVADVSAAIDAYEFNTAAARLYQFIWHEFCDWYIELSKDPLRRGGEDQHGARFVLVHCFDQLLRLLHPFMPFISEELWQALRPYIDEPGLSEHLAIASFPKADADDPLTDAERAAMAHCLEVTDAINSLRSLLGYHPGQRVAALIRHPSATVDGDGFAAEFAAWKPYTMTMAKASSLDLLEGSAPRPSGMVASVLGWGEVMVEAPADFDVGKARGTVGKKLEEVNTTSSSIRGGSPPTSSPRRRGNPRADGATGRGTVGPQAVAGGPRGCWTEMRRPQNCQSIMSTWSRASALSPLLILGEGEGEVTRPDLRHTFRPQPPPLASRP